MLKYTFELISDVSESWAAGRKLIKKQLCNILHGIFIVGSFFFSCRVGEGCTRRWREYKDGPQQTTNVGKSNYMVVKKEEHKFYLI